MKTTEELQAQLDEIQAELNKRKQEPQFEVGKVYKMAGFGNRAIFKVIKLNKTNFAIAYGFNYNFNWVGYSENWSLNGAIPATDEEWEKALILHAKESGFKEGVGFDSVETGEPHIRGVNLNWNYNSAEDSLAMYSSHCGVCYKQGKWAKILEDKKIMIGGYTVEFRADNTIDVGCKKHITKAELTSLRDLMVKYDFESMQFGGNLIHIITINQILSKLI